MHVLFAHHEPLDESKARWVAIVRTLAAVARRARVTWLAADTAARIQDYATGHLGLALPDALEIRTLPSLHRKLGLTLNHVYFRACRRAVTEIGPDLLWIRSDKLAAHLLHKLAPCPPLVYEAHLIGELWAQDRGAPESAARRLHKLESAVYAGAAGVAAISDGLLNEIRERFEYRGKAAVVRSAVEPEVFRPTWKGGDGRTVVYVGTLQFWKGLGTLLEALAQTQDLKLRIIGGGTPAQKAELDGHIKALGLIERVEQLGHVPQHDLPAAIGDAACAVHPLAGGHSISARFTSPLKLFEYMALGLPIVAGDVPSIREILSDGKTTRLFDPGDAAALANALTEVCTDSALAARLSAAAMAKSAEHTYEKRAIRLDEFFTDVAGQ